MFWSHNSHSPQIDSILAKEDLTLNELFNQEGLFQELKSPNKNLIEFITRSDMLTELVRLVTEEPSEELELKERYKQANLACEVLTTDIPLINEKLSERVHLTRLFSFLDAEPPLNPLLASFFARTFSMLICRKHDQNWYSYQYTCLQVLDFLKSQESGLSKLVRHMDTSSIMELTFKLLTQVEGPELQNTLVNLVDQENIIEKLIDLLHPSVDEDRNNNVSNLLVDTINKIKDDLNNNSGDTTNKRRDSHPILDKIQSEAMVKKLLDNIFCQEVTESSIVAGINVLLALICPPPVPAVGRRDICDDSTNGAGGGDPAKAARSLESIKPILLSTVSYLPAVHQLLLHPPKREPIKLTCGTLDPPLGQARLALVRLVAVLVLTYTPEINEELDRLDTINLLLDLFFDYRWNNFLHTQVVRCLNLDFSKAFEQTESSDPFSPGQAKWGLINPLVSSIFIKCHILERIITGAQDNESEQSKGQKRRGYMGHLMTLAGQLYKAMQDNEVFRKWVEDHLKEDEWSSWTTWVSSVLSPSIVASSRCLGGTHPMYQVHGSDVSEPADDLIDKISLIKLNKEDYSQIPGDQVKSFFYTSSNQPEFSLVFYPELSEHNSRVSSKYLNMLQDDGSTDCEAKFQQICSKKQSFWHELPDSHDNSLDASTNSSDEEDKEEDDDNEIWSSCNFLEPDADPWSTGGSVGLNSDDGWADFGNAPVICNDVIPHRSAAVHAAQIASLLNSGDDRLEEDEEPPQVFEVSPEPGEEGDDGGCPPPLPSSPPPPLPASPPPLPSAVPEAPPVLAAQGDSRMPRPLAPPSDPPPPPPTQRVEAVQPSSSTESPEKMVSSEPTTQTVVEMPSMETTPPASIAETAQVTEATLVQQVAGPTAAACEQLATAIAAVANIPPSNETLIPAPEPIPSTSPAPVVTSSTSDQHAVPSEPTSAHPTSAVSSSISEQQVSCLELASALLATVVNSAAAEQSAALSEPASSQSTSQDSENVPLPEVPQVTSSQADTAPASHIETSTQSQPEGTNSSSKSDPR